VIPIIGHGYDWENRQARIKSNREYWIPKIERNMERDDQVNRQLAEKGWVVLRFREWQIRRQLDDCVKQIVDTVGIVQKKDKKFS
jgi:DNA mismatch endonuclease (patch repair protein)